MTGTGKPIAGQPKIEAAVLDNAMKLDEPSERTMEEVLLLETIDEAIDVFHTSICANAELIHLSDAPSYRNDYVARVIKDIERLQEVLEFSKAKLEDMFVATNSD
jgi:hypothetical protein